MRNITAELVHEHIRELYAKLKQENDMLEFCMRWNCSRIVDQEKIVNNLDEHIIFAEDILNNLLNPPPPQPKENTNHNL